MHRLELYCCMNVVDLIEGENTAAVAFSIFASRMQEFFVENILGIIFPLQRRDK